MQVRSIRASEQKYLQNCIRAYLEGSKNLRWILGVIGGAKEQARVIVQTRFWQYAATHIYQDLLDNLL